MDQKAKQLPRATEQPMLERQQSLGADRHVSLLPCRHTSQQSPWESEPLAPPGSTKTPRTQQMSGNTDFLWSTTDGSCSHSPVSVTLPALSTAECARLGAKGCWEQGPRFMEVLSLLPFWQILNIALFRLCMTVFFNTPHNLNVCPPTAN